MNNLFLKFGTRKYVTAAYSAVEPIRSRIQQKNNEIFLQVLSDSNLGPNLKSPTTLREVFLGADWQTLLKIKPGDGITYEKDYIVHNLETNMSIDNIIFHKKLFGVPQLVWEEFLRFLPNQEVSNLLNLRQHRHLWPAYKYSFHDNSVDITRKKAKLIGEYHFLLSLADATDNKLKDIKHDFDNGKFDIKKMREIHNSFSKVFLKKSQHCTNFSELNLLANLVTNYAQKSFDNINKQRQDTAIEWLPSSVNEPIKFLSTLKLAKKIVSISTRSGLILFNSKCRWQSPLNKNSALNKLYFDALFNDLIKRQLILQANQAGIPIDDKLIYLVKEEFETILLQNISISNLERLQARWQNNTPDIELVKPCKTTKSSWEPIISPIEINGIKIRALSSKQELYEHGRLMEHCVQSDIFIKLCSQKKADILIFESNDECSTMDLRIDKKFNINLFQHKAKGGMLPPSDRHLKAGLELVARMKDRRITLSKSRNIEYNDFKMYKNLYDFDYDLNDLKTQNKVYKTYKNNKMLPKSLVFNSYEEMLLRTRLADKIDYILRNTQAHVPQ